ncbi:MAG TPA: nitric oxide reductase transcriptional regulator NorR [Bdellovibrionales bacterium]|nr:MAG: nitric oxide reductase transcription regulator [Bdellovibrionales bacterium GWB1_52_6]OFZ04975.1 MAG: nitric oxide reductase transcription regulator [Bdellovibrionales bacterium GWA1_52_35]OFZ42568.1 MAG: nitric oxide reductase transcription regulator [Bdellovibrionales bacterium GWC1_52_8]HAR41180.1 nitric oxide reductase transcriptional regulator NorR [Bdellovibrionales bacterium]HCM41205.1 nitric oxide reductase transcriptional regulator NorR [Bdellovibrionales bacterium]
MQETSHQLEAILSIATDLTTSISSVDRYERLLNVIKSLLKSDAAALLKKEAGVLRLVAAAGMTPGKINPLLGRAFVTSQHPRLSIISESSDPVLFPADSALPDPFDGFLEVNHGDPIRVHSCLGCPLIVEGKLVGVLTADSVQPGAFDDFDKQFLSTLGALAGATLRTSQLIDTLERTAEKRGLVARELMQTVSESVGSFLLGTSQVMEKLREEIEFAAKCDLSVLITGETGTGKELVARSIQNHSARKSDPMIYVNCAALPESIVESELFGHVRGAFTGAHNHRAGKFEVADGGTIFLDEIGEIPLAVQAKLLRVLQEGEIQRVGSDQFSKVNVRVLAATNRNLLDEIAVGKFRSDLYYRLSVYPIRVPALRAHPEDIPYLVKYFCDLNMRKLDLGAIHFSPQTMKLLEKALWPGNVRELRNVIDRTLVRTQARRAGAGHTIEIHPTDLPTDLLTAASEPVASATQSAFNDSDGSAAVSLREATLSFQRELILSQVSRSGGNWAQAAQALGLHRSNLFSLAKRLGLK